MGGGDAYYFTTPVEVVHAHEKKLMKIGMKLVLDGAVVRNNASAPLMFWMPVNSNLMGGFCLRQLT